MLATLKVLGVEPWSSERAASALNNIIVLRLGLSCPGRTFYPMPASRVPRITGMSPHIASVAHPSFFPLFGLILRLIPVSWAGLQHLSPPPHASSVFVFYTYIYIPVYVMHSTVDDQPEDLHHMTVLSF